MTATDARVGCSPRASQLLFSDGGDRPRPVSPTVVTNDNAEVVTIVARGADAVGSLHRYVTIIDSDGAVYLVGFGDATVPGYLTSDGQWGDGRDLPETMEFGSVMAAYYNDNTEGVNNLAILPVLAGTGVSFAGTPLCLNPGDDDEATLFVPSFTCSEGILRVLNQGVVLGFIGCGNWPAGRVGAIDCSGDVVDLPSSGTRWLTTLNPVVITGEETELDELKPGWNTLMLILQGHINYTWPST